MKSNFNEPQLEQKLSALLQVTAEVLVALKGEAFKEVDSEIVDRLQSRLQEIALAEAVRYELTVRETELWQLRRGAMTYLEIADALKISVNTVKRHLQAIYSKMGL